jgi:hypothetical protein
MAVWVLYEGAEDAQYGTRHLESMGEGKEVSIVLNSEQVSNIALFLDF